MNNKTTVKTKRRPARTSPCRHDEVTFAIFVPLRKTMDIRVGEATVEVTYDRFVGHWQTVGERVGTERDLPPLAVARRRLAGYAISVWAQRIQTSDPAAYLDALPDGQFRTVRVDADGVEALGEPVAVILDAHDIWTAAAWVRHANEVAEAAWDAADEPFAAFV